MPRQSYVTPTLRSRTLAARPAHRSNTAPTKTISQLQPAVVASAVADRAVLVDLHPDQRLSLGAFADDLGVELAATWTVVHLATGCIVVTATDPDDAPGKGLRPLRLDGRRRLRLTAGLVHRLGVPLGGQVLVSADADGTKLSLIGLNLLAQLFATSTADGELEEI